MKKIVYLLVVVILSLAMTTPKDVRSDRKKERIAIDYFKAFHNGELERVFSFLADDCTVQYGIGNPVPAKEFFKNTADLISTFKFEAKGVYSSKDHERVLLHFSFTTPDTEKQKAKTTEAVDIIDFNSENKITKILVIPNQ